MSCLLYEELLLNFRKILTSVKEKKEFHMNTEYSHSIIKSSSYLKPMCWEETLDLHYEFNWFELRLKQNWFLILAVINAVQTFRPFGLKGITKPGGQDQKAKNGHIRPPVHSLPTNFPL